MKFTKSLLSLALAGFLFVSCKDAATSSDKVAATEVANAEAAAPKMETANFSIEGMSCAVGCAKTIEKKLAAADGVKNASIDFEKKSATVEYDASKQSPEKIVEIVEAAADGKTYKVSNVKSSGDQAMNYGDPKDKTKKKKNKKAKAEGEQTAAKNAEDKKAGCADDAKAQAKPACCAAKKACSAEKAAL